jgi:hypothetical protein
VIAQKNETYVNECANFNEDKKNAFILGLCITIAIIVINTILKILIISLITWVGEDT